MAEEGNKEPQSEPESQPQLQTQELSHLLKQKEPENAETSTAVKLEPSGSSSSSPVVVVVPPKDHAATPPLDQTPAAGAEYARDDSVNRDAVLARVESEKRYALIRAWEESEKTKAENRAYKLHSAVELWENSKKASMEAKLKKIEERLDRKKAGYVEIMQNKIAEIHRSAEEKRALIEAQKGEEFLKVEETGAKFRTRGYVPRKLLSCFG